MKILYFISLFMLCSSAQAWDEHQSLMKQIVSQNSIRPYFKDVLMVPSEADQKKELEKIAVDLDVNIAKIPIQKPGKISIAEFLKGESIDEPDFGMDQDLPDRSDPNGDRAWMGGKTGPTSQGFRHMYFPGLDWSHPIRTLQIPTKAIGQAPARILKLQEIATKYFNEKKIYWGLRITLWELHLIQDLHQPFHVTQIPAFGMLPLQSLFKGLVVRTTQVISNFHFAYEGLMREAVSDGPASPMAECFQEKSGSAISVSRLSIDETIRFVREKADKVGEPLLALWETRMKDPETNLPENLGTPDYYAYLNASAEEEDQVASIQAIDLLKKVTCELFSRVTQVTLAELDRVLK